MPEHFGDVSARLQAWGDAVRKQATDDLAEVVTEAEDGVRQIIHTSVTDWGRRRQAGEVGGEPRPYAGRIETGKMHDAVDSRVETPGRDVRLGEWGWIYDPEAYYAVQDQSFEQHATKIVPMEALRRTLDEAEEKFNARLDNLEVPY